MSENRKSLLAVIDGLDGSGKSTQFEMVSGKLSAKGISVKPVSFPDYDMPSSTLVKMYLNGDFSKDAADVNAYAASTFYAADRYASYKLCWEKDYNDGTFILASRYVSSNAIHQMVKLPESEWDGFLEWLFDYEHDKLGLPRADKVIFLDMPVEVSQKLLSGRYNGDESRKDIHESNVSYLNACRKSALYAAEKLGWEVISCADETGSAPLSPEVINEKLMNVLEAII